METIRFGELYAIPSGNGLSRPSAVRGEGYHMIGMGELFECDILSDMEMDRVQMSEREMQSFLVEEDDLLFARQSLVAAGAGKCSIVKHFSEPTTYESHLIRVRLDKRKVNPWYYYYYFKLPDNPIKRIVNQCAQAGIRGSELARVKVPIIDRWKQDQIVSTLFAYDNLIEVNNKRIKVLEQMAENLYKEWFVRFRFPGHETAEFENGIPKGWSIKKVGELCKIITGKKDANEATGKGIYPFFTCARETTLSTDEFILDTNAVLVSGNGSYTGFVKKYSGKFDLYQRTYALYDFDNIGWLFLYWAFKNSFEREYMGGSRGSAIPYITKPNIEKYKIIVPAQELLEKSQRVFEKIHIECVKIEAENKNLAQQRDLLLPRLMSGKLEV